MNVLSNPNEVNTMSKTKIGNLVRSLLGGPVEDGSCSSCGPPPRQEDAGASSACYGPTDSVGEAPGVPNHAAGPAGSFTLRAAEPKDLEDVERLLAGASLPTEDLEDQFGDQYVVAVSTASGEVIGVAGYEIHGGSGLLRSVAVDSAWRGRGVGASLTKDRIDDAEAGGLRALYALTTTADAYFQRFGFRVVERKEVPAEVRASSEFTRVCPSTATVIHKDLHEGPHE